MHSRVASGVESKFLAFKDRAEWLGGDDNGGCKVWQQR